MASNAYTSANITPSSDTFREWVDLTNRISYDMEKYVVTTAPAGNTQGAETVGRAYVNGHFGANTMVVFDTLTGATGNVTNYGTNSPSSNLVISSNAVFVANSTKQAIIHAHANVIVANAGLQITANSTQTGVTINTTASVFESNATINKFNTPLDINANIDTDNDETFINSGNTYIGGNSSAGEFNVDSNTVFNANVHAHANRFEVSSNNVILTSNVDLFKSTATLNDFDSNIDIDNTETDINTDDFNVAGANATITSVNIEINGTAANLDSTTTNINGTTLDINSATVDVDSATAVNFNSPDIGINGALLDINSTTVDVDGTTLDVNSTDVNISGSNVIIDSVNVDIDGTAANLDSTTTNINGTTLDINSATVDVNSATEVDINAPDVNLSGANLSITSVNVDVDGTAANLDSTTTNINGTTLDINSTTVDVDGTLFDVNSTDVNISGANLIIDSTHVDVDGTELEITSDVDIDNTLTDIATDDFNVSGANVTISSTNVNITSTGVTIGDAATDALTVNANTTLTDELNVQGDADFDTDVNIDGSAQIDTKLTVGGATTNAVITSEGNIDTDGTLSVLGVTHLANTANVDGLFRAKAGSIVTGTSNVSTQIYVGANVHATTSSLNIEGTATQGNTLLNATTISVGNSEANTVITKSSINTDGTLTVAGASDLNSTLAVAGVGTFEDETNSTSTSTGSIVTSGGIGIAKSIQVGEEITAAGDSTFNADVTIGSDNQDVVAVNSKVNTSIIPLSNADLSLGSAALTWDIHGDTIRARRVITSSNITAGANLSVLGTDSNVGLLFQTSNADAFSIKTDLTNADTQRRIQLGNTVPTDTVATDRLIVRSAVGNSTIGLLPLHGNNVPLGDDAHRWILSANTGDFSGTLLVGDDGTNGANVRIYANGSAILSGKADVGTTLDVGGATTIGGAVDINSTTNIQDAATLQSTLTVDGHAEFNSTANVDSNLIVGGSSTLNGDVTLGDANSDSVSFVAEVSSNINPESNTQVLGLDDARWSLNANTVDATGDITANADIDVQSEANTNTLRVRSTSGFEGDVTVGNSTVYVTIDESEGDLDATGDLSSVNMTASGTVQAEHLYSTDDLVVDDDATISGLLNVGENAKFSANVNLAINSTAIGTTANATTINVASLGVSANAVLPQETYFQVNTANANIMNVFEQFVVDGSNNTGHVQFGATDQVIVEFKNAVVNTHLLADSTNRDLGSSSAKWGELHLKDQIQIGNSTINATAIVNSTASYITADNIIARDDIVAASSSDKQLKSNILKIDTALDKVELIGGYQFEWNQRIGDFRAGTKDYGVIAQEVEQILPEAVTINSRGYKTVNYNSLIPLLIEAVKELSGRVKDLEKEEEVDG
jgi:hypothetical protein